MPIPLSARPGLLADADEGLPSSTARRGRFLVLLYQFADAEDTADAVETTGVVETADAVEASNLGDDELGARLRVVGEADSLLGALDRLGQELLSEMPDGELSGYLPGAAESVDRTASRLGVPPLQALIGTTGYSPREVPGEILEEMVGLLLRYGAREGPGYLGETALEQAETWLKHGFSNYEGVIRLLRPVQEASRP